MFYSLYSALTKKEIVLDPKDVTLVVDHGDSKTLTFNYKGFTHHVITVSSKSIHGDLPAATDKVEAQKRINRLFWKSAALIGLTNPVILGTVFYLLLPLLVAPFKDIYLSHDFVRMIPSFATNPDETKILVKTNFIFWLLLAPALIGPIFFSILGVINPLRIRMASVVNANKIGAAVLLGMVLLGSIPVAKLARKNYPFIQAGFDKTKISETVMAFADRLPASDFEENE